MAKAKTTKAASTPNPTPPNTALIVEPSSRASRSEWSNDLFRTAELLADRGDLRLVADICDAILADEKVQGALVTLVGALFGTPLTFEAGAGDRRRGRKAIRALEAEEDFWKCFPEEDLTSFVSWAVLAGVALAKIVWGKEDPDTGRIAGRLEIWHVRHLSYDFATRTWKLRVQRPGSVVVDQIEIAPGDATWILYTPRGGKTPWKNGAWRAIARWFLLKDCAISDFGALGERHGQPTFAAQTTVTGAPTGNKGDIRKQLAEDLDAIGRRAAIAMPPGWELKLVEAKADAHGIFVAQCNLADAGITVALHGTNLTNEQGGSYAKALVLNGVHIQVIRSLASTLATCLHEQHLVWWAEFNFGDRRLAPWPIWEVAPPEDLKAKGDAWLAVGSGLAALKALSPRVDVEQLLEDSEVPLLDESEVPEPVPAPEPQSPPNAEDKNAPPPAPAKGDSGAIDHFLLAALFELAKGGPGAPGYVQGQRYADALTDESRARAARALRPDIAAVLAAVKNAGSYDELRTALVETYRKMKPADLAALTEKTLIQGELAGRLSVVEDT